MLIVNRFPLEGKLKKLFLNTVFQCPCTMILNVNDFDFNPNLFELLTNYFDITPEVILLPEKLALNFTFMQKRPFHS